MPREIYDELEWSIGELPIESCTPDEFVEFSYNATAECPECGELIEGTARYWSREGVLGSWLERVDYEPCECQSDEEDDDDDDF